MLCDLGIIHELAPVASPRHKAIIERFFRSLNTFLVDKLPGATLDPSLLRKLGIDPTTEAVVTITELRELIAKFLYLYHVTHHSGIDAIPLQKWSASMAVHGRDMILDGRLIDVVTGVTVHDKRMTAGGGVRMFGLTWKGPGLDLAIGRLAAAEPHRKRLDATAAVTTKIKYNPEDLLKVHVFVGDDWIELENTRPAYAGGLTLWQHRQIRDWAKRESLAFNSEREQLLARHQLNVAIREAFPDMDARERRAMARMTGGGAAKPFVDVEFAVAEPRHDGMGPIIKHDAPANQREDAHRPMSRPAKARVQLGAGDGQADDDDDVRGEIGGQPRRVDPTPILDPGPTDADDLDDEEYR